MGTGAEDSDRGPSRNEDSRFERLEVDVEDHWAENTTNAMDTVYLRVGGGSIPKDVTRMFRPPE